MVALKRVRTVDSDWALRDGLREVSRASCRAGFDDAVIAAVNRPPTFWETLASHLRTGIPIAAFSATCMILFIHFMLDCPVTTTPALSSSSSVGAVLDMDKFMRQIESPNFRVRDSICLATAGEARTTAYSGLQCTCTRRNT